MSGQTDEVRTAGRGLLSITGAKLYFILASYAIQLTLPRLLATEKFGLFSTAMTTVSILNNVLIVSTVQSVSKLVSEDDAQASSTLRQGLRLQLVIGGVLAAAMFSLGPLLARHVLLDAALAPLFRVASIVVFAYALYATLVGSLNGRRQFQSQAALDATFSTLRAVGILGAAALGFGAIGAIGGFAAAALGVLLVGLTTVGPGRGGPSRSVGDWLRFMAPLWGYHVFLNMVMMSDLLVLKRTVAELSLAGGEPPVAAADVASRFAGFYRAAQTFAFVPYQLILSITFVIFPMVSRATTAGDARATRDTVHGAMRFSVLALLAIAAPISGAADGVMQLAYPEAYLAGAPALRVLVFGMVMFALFVISATVLSGSGRPAFAAGIGALGLVVVITANRLLVMAAGIEGETLEAAAIGTSLGTALAMLAAGIIVRTMFGAWIPPLAALRGAGAAAVAFFVAETVPHESPWTALVALAAGFGAFVVSLAVTGEIRREDIRVGQRVLRR